MKIVIIKKLEPGSYLVVTANFFGVKTRKTFLKNRSNSEYGFTNTGKYVGCNINSVITWMAKNNIELHDTGEQ